MATISLSVRHSVDGTVRRIDRHPTMGALAPGRDFDGREMALKGRRAGPISSSTRAAAELHKKGSWLET